jgi:hypothetical protein
MLKRNIAIVTIAVVVLGTGAYAWATGAPSRPTTSALETNRARSGAPARAAAGRGAAGGPFRRAHRLGGRAVHGDLIVRGRTGFENVAFDRGDVVRHSATSVTLKRADGVEVTKAISGDTRFRGIGSVDELVDSRAAIVVSKGDTAVLVAQRPTA